MKKKPFYFATLLAFCFILVGEATAQTNYFSTSVFNNKVRFNPSQAGMSKGYNFDAALKTPRDNSQSGLPTEFSLSADMPISESAAAGIVFESQTGGLLRQTRLNFCYAYGMKLKENLNLRFGIAAGFKNVRTETASNLATIVGDPNDPALSAYNSIPPSFYNAFSFTLYTNDFELQVVAPNLTAAMQNKNLQSLDYLQLQGGLTYTRKVGGGGMLNENSYIKLFAGMMKYKETGSVISGGAMLSANDFLSANVQYNSSGVITAGIGIPIEKTYNIFVNYSIGGLYSKTIYGGGGVAEIHFNCSFKKK